MKASYLWQSGPKEREEVVLSGGERIEMGPAGEGRVEIPGADAIWAVVEFRQGRCYLSRKGGPELTIQRKTKGDVQTLPVTDEPVETKSNDIVIFGEGGPSLYSHYELELSDRFGLKAEDMDDAVSPLSADRRKQKVAAHSVPKAKELEKVRDRAVEAQKTAETVTGDLGQTKMKVRSRMIGLSVAGVVGAALLAVVGAVALSRTEARLSKRLEGALEKTRADFEENKRMLNTAREEARREIDRLERSVGELKEGDPRLETLQAQLDAYRLELNENKPLEKVFAAMQDRVDQALFLIGCAVVADRPCFPDPERFGYRTDTHMSVGTGFLVDDQGSVITCKHVVQPWKFPEMAGPMAMAEAKVKEVTLVAIPVGRSFQVLAPYSTTNGKLKLVRTAPDKLEETFVAMELGTVKASVESDSINDVALLKIDAPGHKPIPLATDEEFEAMRKRKVWPVMVAGFPTGLLAFDRDKVASSMTLGNVRKIEKFVQHTAPTCGGNSGGPLIDEKGRVVGVVSYMLAGQKIQNLNVCVPAPEANKLLQR